tara:strand:- start:31 stop:366 length:336 start_codon:yes stop_codon:yes gene_type:complete
VLLDQDQNQVDQILDYSGSLVVAVVVTKPIHNLSIMVLVVEEVIKLQNHHFLQMLFHMQVQEVEETAEPRLEEMQFRTLDLAEVAEVTTLITELEEMVDLDLFSSHIPLDK